MLAPVLPADKANTTAADWPRPDWLARHDTDPRYEWARIQWARAASQPGARFHHAKARRVVEAWPRMFRLTKLQYAGKPFHLADYQDVIVRFLFGWYIPVALYDPDTRTFRNKFVRLYRRLMLWLARKGAKTEFLACLAQAVFAFDNQKGQEGYVFAATEDQAKIPFERMQLMALSSPGFNAPGRTPPQAFAKSIYFPEISSSFVLLTGKGGGKHGKLPKVILGDEMHEWTNRDIEETLRQGTGTVEEPMELYGSTTGMESDGPGIELYEETQAIIDGTMDDPRTLGVIFAAGKDDPIDDPETWKKANPLYPITPSDDYLRGELAKAKGNSAKEARFRAYHCNVWVQSVERWIDAGDWNACNKSGDWREKAQKLRGRHAICGVDMSENHDFTAKVLLFPPIDGESDWQVACHFWLPERSLLRMPAREAEMRRKWAEMGALTLLHDTACIDEEQVADAILRDAETFQLDGVPFDPWRFMGVYNRLCKDGMPEDRFLKVRQGIKTMGAATRELARLVAFPHRIDHGGHPLLGWMAGNVRLRKDDNNSAMPTKKRSRSNIDGISALLNCIVMTLPQEDDGLVTGGDIVDLV